MSVRTVVRTVEGVEVPEGRMCLLWCPGCDATHAPRIRGEDGSMPPGPVWQWDGNLEAPTFEASYLVYESGSVPRCHSFIREGRWEFLADCTHDLAGQTVPMVPLPDWLLP